MTLAILAECPVCHKKQAVRNGLFVCGEDLQYGKSNKDGLVFHDLRHIFNTNMRKAGVPESTIMEITGHSIREMFLMYDTIDEKNTRNALRQFENFLQSVDLNVDPSPLHNTKG